jgi:1-acyl-sn-glycerol-3-phosphate acyltransferase
VSDVVAPGDGYRAFTPDRTWAVARMILQSWYAPAMRLRVYGRERVPASGPAVVAANHIAGIDPIVLGMASPRTLRYMAKVELWSIPVVRRVLPHTGAFPVRRGQADRDAIANARRVLQAGELLGIFVEGTRQESDEIGDARTGAAMLAIAEDAPIVPACIMGTDRQKRNPFHPATVAWGTPIDASGLRRSARTYRLVAGAIEDELRRLRAFVHAVDAAGRPPDAVPPESRPLEERIDEPA